MTAKKESKNRSLPVHWRSLEELRDSAGLEQFIKEESGPVIDELGRRRFLQLMGASLALAGVSGCTMQPDERIVPFVQAPEELIPGKPLHFATAMPQNGYGIGLLVESHDGRPTKAEGNPLHPAALGAANLLAQASILDLYDPDRIQVVTNAGRVRTWEIFRGLIRSELESIQVDGGRGLRILTGTITSPTLASQLKQLLDLFPEARWHQYQAVNADAAFEGSRHAFGRDVNTYYRLDKAEVVVSLDSDFLFCGPASLRYAREFASKRRAAAGMSRFYAAESTPTVTGTMADHRLAVRSKDIEALAQGIAYHLGIDIAKPALADESLEQWIDAVAKDLKDHKGSCVVIPGDFQKPEVHALAHWMNHVLGNDGKTVVHTDPVEANPANQVESLTQLVEDMNSGDVEILVMLGGDTLYTAPQDLGFGEALASVPLSVHLSSHFNETSESCTWVIPESHYLEAWSDVRAFDGTISIVQPLIEPLYRSKSCHELLAVMLDQTADTSYEVVQDYWSSLEVRGNFDKWWRQVLHDGVMEGTSLPGKQFPIQTEPVRKAVSALAKRSQDGLELLFRPDPSVFDGRHSNNAWLQELPKPLTKLTWDNAAIVSPQTGEALNLASGDVVLLELDGRSVEAPVWLQPGHPAEAVTVHLGYGQKRLGKVGERIGFDAYCLRSIDSMWAGTGLNIEKTGRTYELVSTQNHDSMEGRDLVRLRDVGHSHVSEHSTPHGPDHSDASLFPAIEYKGYAWGMAVDLSACTGCNACVVACQAENNIAVVGKEEVAKGREMHWIRIDRYYSGEADAPQTLHQPIMCQHCETAPCESVCPVAATVHSAEGLNDMVYNRCVGTRYCSNNCPYKVRRFNFLLYSDWHSPSLKLQRNPDVTVRSRGVMEKCTYCVQRINEAKIQAKLEDRRVQDGDIQTACQQTCPSQAIVFGDTNDPDSRVAKLKADQRNYGILTELKTVPRTTYLEKLKNSNQELSS